MDFKFYLGGYGRNNYRLTLKGNVLSCFEYYRLPIPDQEMLVPMEDGNNDWVLLLELVKKASGKDPIGLLPAMAPNGIWK